MGVHRRWLLIGLALPALAAAQQPAATTGSTGSAWPVKPIRLVTGSQAGGGTDLNARALQPGLVSATGVQWIVDNRPGGAGMVANEYVSRQPADGYTLLLQPGSFVTVSPQLNATPVWDTLKHLQPIIQVSSYDFVLVAHPSVPAKSVGDLVALARRRPGGVSFASSGVGSNFQLAGELLKLEAGVDLLHVAYRGSPPAIIDLVAGRVDTMFVHVPAVKAHIDAGRLRALAVTGGARNAQLPAVPTVAESGYRRYELTGTEGLFAPAGTPREIVMRLNTIAGTLLASADLRALWASRAIEFTPNSPDQYTARLKSDFERTAALIKAADIKPER